MSITLSHITAGYPGKPPLFRDFSLTLPDAGVIAFTGPSGSGKTTLLRLLCGQMPPQSGAVEGLADKKIAVVFQENRLLPWCTVLQNVSLVGEEETARRLLEQMELGDWLSHYPAELSGGMQRRVAIARALCYGGDVLVLDEPFKGLDDDLKLRLIPIIRQSAPLILLVTHDKEDIAALAADCITLTPHTADQPATAILTKA